VESMSDLDTGLEVAVFVRGPELLLTALQLGDGLPLGVTGCFL